MRRRALWLAAALVCAVPAWAAAPALKAGVFEPPQAAPELGLQASDGAELKLARFKGKVVAVAFGFTHCQAVCPVTLYTLAQARKAMGKEGEGVQVVFITVDPERDTAQQMRSFLQKFDPSFLGGVGAPPAVAAVEQRFGVSAKKVPMADGDYAMSHSSAVYLIDREGKLRAMMPFGHGVQDYVHDFRLLLAQR